MTRPHRRTISYSYMDEDDNWVEHTRKVIDIPQGMQAWKLHWANSQINTSGPRAWIYDPVRWVEDTPSNNIGMLHLLSRKR